MKIVFAGTPNFSADHLKILQDNKRKIELVLTQPDKKSGRGNKYNPPPVKAFAEKVNIRVLQPKRLKNNIEIEHILKEINPDIILVIAYGLIIPKEILKIPKIGCINIHASLLPRWRGAAPIERCILNGDTKSGLTFMEMDKGLDTGPILERFSCEISPLDTSETLENKLINISKKKLDDFLSKLEEGDIKKSKQDENLATYAEKITKKETQIIWEKHTSTEIDRMIRSFLTKQGAFTYLGDKRIKILKAEKINKNLKLNPGGFLINKLNEIEVSCKNNSSLRIMLVQLENKTPSPAQDFTRGYKSLIDFNSSFNSLK
ncbi:MAG: methionyl-tRNA formyltransferase [Gammaproteobacteria bacterium]|nr:methionyl-tRNA formyltransferase [Gammaproteobacteria bacterium]|tara:strand:+ start:800 stop:1753 length:954 start_codon:yes stop_codon:yes gene_type:complete